MLSTFALHIRYYTLSVSYLWSTLENGRSAGMILQVFFSSSLYYIADSWYKSCAMILVCFF